MTDTPTFQEREYHRAMHRLYRAVLRDAEERRLSVPAFLELWEQAKAEKGWEVPS